MLTTSPTAAIGVSILAIQLSRRPPTSRHPHGYPRATRYAALVNVGWLPALSVLITASAIARLAGGVHQVHGLPVLVVSSIAAALMLGSALLLGGDLNHDNADDDDEGDALNVRPVLLDTAADAAAAAGVATTGAVVYASHGLYWLDPAVALTISIVVGCHATRMLLQIREVRAH